MSTDAVRKLRQINQSALLRAVSEVSQAVVAERSGLSPTLVSRLLAGKDGAGGADEESAGAVERVLALAAACNLKLVPCSYTAVDPDEWRATLHGITHSAVSQIRRGKSRRGASMAAGP